MEKLYFISFLFFFYKKRNWDELLCFHVMLLIFEYEMQLLCNAILCKNCFLLKSLKWKFKILTLKGYPEDFIVCRLHFSQLTGCTSRKLLLSYSFILCKNLFADTIQTQAFAIKIKFIERNMLKVYGT